MTIKIIGKRHMEGKSKKTGKDYNLNEVHYNSPARSVEGLAAKTILLNGSMYPYENLLVNAEYHVEFDEKGYPVEFSRISASSGK